MKRFFIFLLLTACGKGTGTGNPHTDLLAARGTASGRILIEVCHVVAACHLPVTEVACFSNIQYETGFSANLGLVDPITSRDMIASEAAGELIPNHTEAASCQSKISLLQCSDPRVLNAYKAEEPFPMRLAFEMLDPSCTGVFGSGLSGQ